MTPTETYLLEMCADDSTPVCAAFDSVGVTEAPESFADLKRATLELVTRLIKAGLILPGEWAAGVVGLKFWEGEVDDICQRVEDHFETLSQRPSLDDPLWLQATEAGKDLILENE
jgi:hypothetical protein